MDWCCCLCCQAYYLQQSFNVHFYLASAHCRLRLLFVADMVFCLLSPFFTRLDGFCMWRAFSVQHLNLTFCQLQPVWAYFQWPLSPFLFLTIHKTDDLTHHTKLSLLRHCFPAVSCFTMCYIWTCLLSHFFFVFSNFSRSVCAMTKMLVHSVTLMIPYKNLHDLKKKWTAVPLYILSWFKCYLSSSLLHSEWRHERQQVISFTATSTPASLPGIQRALGALILIIKPSHCSELTSQMWKSWKMWFDLKWMSFGHWKLRASCIDMSIHTSIHFPFI